MDRNSGKMPDWRCLRLGCMQLAAAVLLVVAAGCDARTTVSGRISDQAGHGVGGANVSLKLGDVTVRDGATSDPDGSYGIGGTHAGTRRKLTLTVSKPGYQEQQLDVKPGVEQNLNVTLESLAADSP